MRKQDFVLRREGRILERKKVFSGKKKTLNQDTNRINGTYIYIYNGILLSHK